MTDNKQVNTLLKLHINSILIYLKLLWIIKLTIIKLPFLTKSGDHRFHWSRSKVQYSCTLKFTTFMYKWLLEYQHFVDGQLCMLLLHITFCSNKCGFTSLQIVLWTGVWTFADSFSQLFWKALIRRWKQTCAILKYIYN